LIAAYGNRIDKAFGELQNLLNGFEVIDPFDQEFNSKITKIRTAFKVFVFGIDILQYRSLLRY
jgi:hypothetical protein